MSNIHPPQNNIHPLGDPISQLPVDKDPPNNDEIHLVNSLFEKKRSTMDLILADSKDALLAGSIVIIFSLPQITAIINKILPLTINSIYILVLIKGLIATIIFWLIKYFYLSRKK